MIKPVSLFPSLLLATARIRLSNRIGQDKPVFWCLPSSTADAHNLNFRVMKIMNNGDENGSFFGGS